MPEMSFFFHANSEELLNHYQKMELQPIQTAMIDDYEADKYDVLNTDNVFEAFSHYWEAVGDMAAIVSGETDERRVWCELNGYVWLFATFSFSAPDYDGERYIFAVHCHFDSALSEAVGKR